MGQLSSSATAAIKRSLSSCSIAHSSSMCSVVWLSFPHGQFGASMILNLWGYDLMLPWPVTIVVKFCVRCIFVCSLSATFGK